MNFNETSPEGITYARATFRLYDLFDDEVGWKVVDLESGENNFFQLFSSFSIFENNNNDDDTWRGEEEQTVLTDEKALSFVCREEKKRETKLVREKCSVSNPWNEYRLVFVHFTVRSTRHFVPLRFSEHEEGWG